ncbi:30S ribosomal protein S9 [Candidatus Methylacidiphilum infernorum]|uniref:Small ribosomal subunit protein uS9 n=1 Tax=Methylacidiphilum infernorum (isolate V4) TaxID=481448 RepID=RS9_METI4|nr:30S ribosomal protein S9 [Candidatus Methylacidiphilum infernorum]B3E0U1.1 RecName: Full=Small ribosomal subunit protein uS9; AltName: Full=30S ribosomal protein S9 [Methylacidiphilum infernorum V4]ACD84418.1 Ribosomal protein S9 [Methylacidiphilum infernorum V4]
MTMTVIPQNSPIQATGRRKTATATVILKPGKGEVSINGKDLEFYFPTFVHRYEVFKPLEVIEGTKKFDIIAKARGGGLMGQAQALKLAVSRALIKYDPSYRSLLKKEGLLTRDPRMKERKKTGQPGARKRFQFSKR